MCLGKNQAKSPIGAKVMSIVKCALSNGTFTWKMRKMSRILRRDMVPTQAEKRGKMGTHFSVREF